MLAPPKLPPSCIKPNLDDEDDHRGITDVAPVLKAPPKRRPNAPKAPRAGRGLPRHELTCAGCGRPIRPGRKYVLVHGRWAVHYHCEKAFRDRRLDRGAVDRAKSAPRAKRSATKARKGTTPTVVWRFACPECHARIGEACKAPNGRRRPPHPGRLAKLGASQRRQKNRRSVWTVSGGGFETNRRRH